MTEATAAEEIPRRKRRKTKRESHRKKEYDRSDVETIDVQYVRWGKQR